MCFVFEGFQQQRAITRNTMVFENKMDLRKGHRVASPESSAGTASDFGLFPLIGWWQ
jgi:hypothetical protein